MKRGLGFVGAAATLAAAAAVVNVFAPLVPAAARLQEITGSLPRSVVWMTASGLLCVQAIRLVLAWVAGARKQRPPTRVREPGPLARLREDLASVDAQPHRRERVALPLRASVIAETALARDLSEREARTVVERGEWTEDPLLAGRLVRLWQAARDRFGESARAGSYLAEVEDFLGRLSVSRGRSG